MSSSLRSPVPRVCKSQCTTPSSDGGSTRDFLELVILWWTNQIIITSGGRDTLPYTYSWHVNLSSCQTVSFDHKQPHLKILTTELVPDILTLTYQPGSSLLWSRHMTPVKRRTFSFTFFTPVRVPFLKKYVHYYLIHQKINLQKTQIPLGRIHVFTDVFDLWWTT